MQCRESECLPKRGGTKQSQKCPHGCGFDARREFSERNFSQSTQRPLRFILNFLCALRSSVRNFTYSVGLFFKFLLSAIALPSPTFCSIIARTLRGRPNKVMKP